METITVVQLAIGGIGAVVSVTRIWDFVGDAYTKEGKRSREMFDHAVATLRDQPGWSDFLREVEKEAVMYQVFKRTFPNSEIGRIMAYYKRGFATTSDIRQAWPYRNRDSDPLSFKMGCWRSFQFWATRIFGTLFIMGGIMSLLSCFYLAPARWMPLLWLNGTYLFAMGLYIVYLNFGLLVAHRLAQKE